MVYLDLDMTAHCGCSKLRKDVSNLSVKGSGKSEVAFMVSARSRSQSHIVMTSELNLCMLDPRKLFRLQRKTECDN